MAQQIFTMFQLNKKDRKERKGACGGVGDIVRIIFSVARNRKIKKYMLSSNAEENKHQEEK